MFVSHAQFKRLDTPEPKRLIVAVSALHLSLVVMTWLLVLPLAAAMALGAAVLRAMRLS